MAYTYDSEGRIYRAGTRLSEVGVNLPARDSDFSIGYAICGLLGGFFAGLSICVLVRLLIAIFSADASFDQSTLNAIFSQVFTREFIFTTPAIIIASVFAGIGFFWDGIEFMGDLVLFSFAGLGLLLGALMGLLFGILILAVCEAIGLAEEDVASAKIFVIAVSASAVLGFIWNGINTLRDSFAVHRAFVGLLCGIVKGVGTIIRLLAAGGCFLWIILSILAPLTAVVAVLMMVFFAFQGFFVIGFGGRYGNLWPRWEFSSDD